MDEQRPMGAYSDWNRPDTAPKPDPSPEERAVEVLAEALRVPKAGIEHGYSLSLAKGQVQALSSAGLHITDQPGQDELHEAQMEAEHYREILERGDGITPEEAKALLTLLESKLTIDSPPVQRGEASVRPKLRRLASLHPDEKGTKRG